MKLRPEGSERRRVQYDQYFVKWSSNAWEEDKSACSVQRSIAYWCIIHLKCGLKRGGESKAKRIDSNAWLVLNCWEDHIMHWNVLALLRLFKKQEQNREHQCPFLTNLMTWVSEKLLEVSWCVILARLCDTAHEPTYYESKYDYCDFRIFAVKTQKHIWQSALSDGFNHAVPETYLTVCSDLCISSWPGMYLDMCTDLTPL